MKKIFFLFLFTILTSTVLLAQDIIVMKNGDEIKSKVSEIGTNEIKYKKFDNPEGAVISVSKLDVFMIRYENGTKDVINQSTASTHNNVYVTDFDKKYRALFYLGLSIPIGPFGSTTSNDAGAAKIGGAIGHEGDLRISENIIYFTYNVNAAWNPYEISFPTYNPNGYQGEKFSGNYILFYGMAGFKFKSKPSDNRFYGLLSVGINSMTISGDFADYGFSANGYSVLLETTGGSNVALCAGMGIEIKNKFNIGLRYISSNPKFTQKLTWTDPLGIETESLEGNQKVGVLQVLLGYEF